MQTYRLCGVFTLVLFLFSFTAFAQQTAADKTTVEIKKSTFYLNGTAVKLPIKAADLEKIIGKPDRAMEGARKVSTWDKLGLTGYQKTDSDEFIEIGVILNVTDNAFDFTPEKPFIGSFTIDGAKDINIALVSHGASSVNLTFVIKEEFAAAVIKSLHEELF